MDHSEEISRLKQSMGKELAILAHHYQSDAIVDVADRVGDSLELARCVPDIPASDIVFCGVFFMAESAAIIADSKGRGQRVYTPEPKATCVMSEMAPARLVETVLANLTANGRRVIPLAYVNSSAAVKAVVGEYGGAACTSANASRMLQWALERGDGTLFLPDKNLALNSANALEIPTSKRHILDIRGKGAHVGPDTGRHADVLIWPGCCAIHARFKRSHIRQIRERDADVQVIAHPECSPEVVAASDGAGSTSFIIKYAEEAPAGSHIRVATEINLVERLGERYYPDKIIRPLVVSSCSNMAKVTPDKLAMLLHDISLNAAEPARTTEKIATPANAALQRMLDARR